MSVVGSGRFRATPNFRESRKRRLARVRLVTSDNSVQEVMVRDVSGAGLSAAASVAPPARDEIVAIHLPDGREFWGIVRWVDRNLFGVEFDVAATESGPQAAAPAGTSRLSGTGA